MCLHFLYNFFFIWIISHSEKNSARYCRKCAHVCLRVQYRYCQILIKLEFSGQIFEKCQDRKFHEDLSSGSKVVPCGQTDGQRDMRTLIVAFCNFVNAPKNTRPQIHKAVINKHVSVEHHLRNTDLNISWKKTQQKTVRLHYQYQPVSEF